MIRIEHDPDGFLVCRASGKLTEADYDAAIPELENAIGLATGPMRLMIVLEDFRGWEIGALWKDLRFDLRHRNDLGRVAIIGESKTEEWIGRLSKPFFDAEIRYFDAERLDEAREWLSAEKTGGAGGP